uniref:Bem1 n=1 Tax=Rhizophagus irregularis TaxID=588596 RepID=A0A1C9II61_9GLOM|nr:Bem1 [Rhizophagus irregularis]
MKKVPRNFKPLDFRRSVTKDKISTPIAIPTKAPPSILPPKKVIKALYDYDANGPKELSFSKGDFFHVVGNENDPDWYEACNPATNKQGLVPVSYFQVLEKVGRMSGTPLLDSSYKFGVTGGNKPQPLYGIVLYDFVAERPDELDAKAGEPIIVIAQSNHEWFVAKPIGRLGGPGLIPVSFIEIRDHSTGRAIENVQELMDKSVVPKVEEWKKMTQDYQENSISLGRLDFSKDVKLAPIGMDPVNLSPVTFDKLSSPQDFNNNDNDNYDDNDNVDYYYGQVNGDDNRNSDASDTLPVNEGYINDIISASVESFHFKDDKYWFVVRVEMATGRFRFLYRLYEDFYEFQIALLNKFREEAGRTGKQRILPFMPGPLSYVNDMITSQRRTDLDVYVKELLTLPGYILSDPLMNDLFGLKSDDVETDNPRQPGEVAGENGRASLLGLDSSPIDPTPPMSSTQYQPSSYNVFQQPKKQPSLNGGFKHNTGGSSFTSGGQPPFMRSSRVHDESSNDPTSTPSPTYTSSHKMEGLRIKIEYRGDLYAILLSKDDMNFSRFQKKLFDRFGNLDDLKYRDSNGEFVRLQDEAALNKALKIGNKLLLSLDQ